MKLTALQLENFLKKIKKTDSCWLWQGGINQKTGYGQFNVKPKLYSAHRVAYEIFKRRIPKGFQVCHTCDVRACVNPDHLWLGTNTDNVRDCITKGRHYKHDHLKKTGVENHNSKLTHDDVTQIRELLRLRVKQKFIATKFNVHISTIERIKAGKAYKEKP